MQEEIDLRRARAFAKQESLHNIVCHRRWESNPVKHDHQGSQVHCPSYALASHCLLVTHSVLLSVRSLRDNSLNAEALKHIAEGLKQNTCIQTL